MKACAGDSRTWNNRTVAPASTNAVTLLPAPRQQRNRQFAAVCCCFAGDHRVLLRKLAHHDLLQSQLHNLEKEQPDLHTRHRQVPETCRCSCQRQQVLPSTAQQPGDTHPTRQHAGSASAHSRPRSFSAAQQWTCSFRYRTCVGQARGPASVPDGLRRCASLSCGVQGRADSTHRHPTQLQAQDSSPLSCVLPDSFHHVHACGFNLHTPCRHSHPLPAAGISTVGGVTFSGSAQKAACVSVSASADNPSKKPL